jgi:hypothetical protein
MRKRGIGDHQILLAIAHAAMILAPRHFAGVGFQIRPRDMVMRADFRAAQPGKEALGLVRASAFV